MSKKGKKYNRRGARRRVERLQVLYELFCGHCAICTRSVTLCTYQTDPLKATVDHIIPRALGGEDKWWNLQLACYECNHKKGASPEV